MKGQLLSVMMFAGAVINLALPLQKSAYWLFLCLVSERTPASRCRRCSSKCVSCFGSDQGRISGLLITLLLLDEVKKYAPN
jgi:hypothetical protein